MALVEQILPTPDWLAALDVALRRPTGTPERRHDEDPWDDPDVERPRRISDDLAWLRQAVDDPAGSGLTPREGTAAVALWDADGTAHSRLTRLAERGVLEAAGFLLHDENIPE